MAPDPPLTIYTRKPVFWSDEPESTEVSERVQALQRQIDFQDLEIECYRSQLLGAGSTMPFCSRSTPPNTKRQTVIRCRQRRPTDERALLCRCPRTKKLSCKPSLRFLFHPLSAAPVKASPSFIGSTLPTPSLYPPRRSPRHKRSTSLRRTYIEKDHRRARSRPVARYWTHTLALCSHRRRKTPQHPRPCLGVGPWCSALAFSCDNSIPPGGRASSSPN